MKQEQQPGLSITFGAHGTTAQVHPDIILGLFSLVTGVSTSTPVQVKAPVQKAVGKRTYTVRKLHALSGGDILHTVHEHPKGLTIKQIARRLKVTYNRLIVPLSRFVREQKLAKLITKKGALYFCRAQ